VVRQQLYDHALLLVRGGTAAAAAARVLESEAKRRRPPSIPASRIGAMLKKNPNR